MSTVVTEPRQISGLGRAVLTFFACLLVGPPVGGIVFAIALASVPWLRGMASVDIFTQLKTTVETMMLAVSLSYIFGGLQSIAVGAMLAARGWATGSLPFRFAVLAAAAAVSLAYGMRLVADDGLVFPVILSHVLPTLVCWAIVRHLWRKAGHE